MSAQQKLANELNKAVYTFGGECYTAFDSAMADYLLYTTDIPVTDVTYPIEYK